MVGIVVVSITAPAAPARGHYGPSHKLQRPKRLFCSRIRPAHRMPREDRGPRLICGPVYARAPARTTTFPRGSGRVSPRESGHVGQHPEIRLHLRQKVGRHGLHPPGLELVDAARQPQPHVLPLPGERLEPGRPAGVLGRMPPNSRPRTVILLAAPAPDSRPAPRPPPAAPPDTTGPDDPPAPPPALATAVTTPAPGKSPPAETAPTARPPRSSRSRSVPSDYSFPFIHHPRHHRRRHRPLFRRVPHHRTAIASATTRTLNPPPDSPSSIIEHAFAHNGQSPVSRCSTTRTGPSSSPRTPRTRPG